MKKYIDDKCPICGKFKKVRTDKIGSKCRSCGVKVGNLKKYANKKNCKYKNCFKRTTVDYCRFHKKLVIDRHKVKARWTVNNAIVSGRLKREVCRVCRDSKSEAHHPDHAKPLLIVLLCRKDHLTAHGGKFN